MRLVYYRGPEEVMFSYFWVNDQNQRVTPTFTTEDEAKQWLIKSVTTTADEPPKQPKTKEKPQVEISDRYTEGFNAGKLFAELEFIELKQEILELIEDAKPSKLPDVLKRIKELLK